MRKKTASALPCPTEESSVNVRKIANGFIVEKSGMERGKYQRTETFHPTNPLDAVAKPKAPTRKKPSSKEKKSW